MLANAMALTNNNSTRRRDLLLLYDSIARIGAAALAGAAIFGAFALPDRLLQIRNSTNFLNQDEAPHAYGERHRRTMQHVTVI
jgi:hypothetical protein